LITPRQTRLVRVPDLHAFRGAISRLIATAKNAALVVVPTAGAGRQLARTMPSGQFVTRDQLYDRLQACVADAPRRLTVFERDVMFQAAARSAAAVSRRVRPGLVSEIIRFYDLLRRQSQQVQRFEELIHERLAGDAESDVGAARMREQTRFLAGTFRNYEQRVHDSGACDEHTLREWLIAMPGGDPIRHIIVTVPDWIADPDGLFVADFDLLTRIPGLERLDIVATEAMLRSGFHERLHTWWPGLDEIEEAAVGAEPNRIRPALIAPGPDARWFTVRDREEELLDVARRLQVSVVDVDRAAVVYKRPLPYLYLAADTLGAAAIPYQSSDALPLAAEPAAAVLDLVIDFVASGFTRAATVALLRSPHLIFSSAGVEIGRQHVSALDHALSDGRYLGELTRLELVVNAARSPDAHLAGAAAVAAAQELVPLTTADAASVQLRRLLAFVEAHSRDLADSPLAERDRRGRMMLAAGLVALSDAYAAHDDVPWTIDDLSVALRRWIEDETFVLEPSSGGVQLLDDRAARYGGFDDMTIVGLVEDDWPEKTRRNIFYPSNLMKTLGWPSEKDRRAAAEARFLDLVASASRSVALYTITLEDEALVEPSTLLDEVPRARLSIALREPGDAAIDHAEADEIRSPLDAPQYHGQVGAMDSRPWSISAIETYLGCPFKFFAQHVLKLEEEPDDEEVMDPRAQGQFVHEVFEKFFRAWQQAGRGAITPVNLDLARELFAAVVDSAAEALPGAEAALERTRLLGSPAAAGLGEAVFRMEAERPVAVVERLLEHKLEGTFAIVTDAGVRHIALRGKADRIDLLGDGTFRLIDYKLGWPPDRRKALQLSIYGVCAEQRLAGRHGRAWALGEAAYLAFKGPRRVVPLFQSADARGEALGDAQQRLADALDAIGRGEFPPTPDDVHRCETCAFASVCRKDYVGDV
jgi:ATP-dependent helicase/nuclease subunit B